MTENVSTFHLKKVPTRSLPSCKQLFQTMWCGEKQQKCVKTDFIGNNKNTIINQETLDMLIVLHSYSNVCLFIT